ncbi:DnaJ domain-containing protein [Hirsutella rhossiliensis]|uniref:Tetratricopeptide repeat and J domain-containing co-chaperone DNJ1 n=1 Tax=Hirsutella rhossiliensis TaxID=111463 RepID=A0A9P8MMT6_9HYPO|nr:dnaJ domain-containing protein [Hirsutella rhossiliensis]KAH0957960.1 dnaJ domain-containing protein [Hirsutella rhossiliensis]
MRFDLSSLAVTASLLASAGSALSSHDVPSDLPVSALLTSAQSLLARGETSEALVYYDAALAKDPTNYLTLFKRATTYLSLGRAAQATDDFNKVLALKPGFEGAHLQLAKIKSKAAEWEAARAEYKAANRDLDSTEVAELAEAEGAARLANDAASAAQWDDCVNHAGVAILVASRSPSLRQLRARCRFERGEVEEGMGDLHHVLQMRPGDTDPRVLISATTFYGLGDFDNGLAQVRKCLHSDPDSKVCKKLHKQQKLIHKIYTKAQGQLNKGQSTTAGRTLIGNAEEPGLITKIREQVEELRQDGRIPAKSTARLYDQTVEMVCQAYSESNHRDAQKYCDEALQLDSQSFWGLVHRGKVLLKKEEFEAAIEALNKAAEARPDKQDKVNPILNKAQIALKHSKTKDYYKILGVPRDADERQIKSAYRKASKQHHPDKAAKQGVNKEEAEKKMASINEAYEVLSDPELRTRFDNGDDPNSQERTNPFQGQPFPGGNPFMFQQQGGGGQANFKFHFGGGGGGGGPFGF